MRPAKTFSLHSNSTPKSNVKETLLCEYETLLKNIILSENVLQQIVQKNQDARFNCDPRVIEQKKDLSVKTKPVKTTKRSTMKNGMLTQKPDVRSTITSKNEENRPINNIRANLTQSQNNMDCVTTLATQLLRDDAEKSRDHNEVVIDSKGRSTGGSSAQMQAKNLSQLLPNLHSLAVESGQCEFLFLP
ncbi:hypothetical protein PHET_10765 [Paragonimus heterotremus]|uniref:Uncharacterized protein n=1 Tax=Paragonimus heterotremus TaxID=100268 RepID=A0A8J4SNF3_9TREM|nr:hypothetical protein PHET_10765 [Paragonimus heterotremus]